MSDDYTAAHLAHVAGLAERRRARESRRAAFREQLSCATRLAEASVWSDRRMLGLPHIRWRVVECAAHHVLSGLERDPIMDLHGVCEQDIPVVMQALLAAIDAVRASMDCSPKNLQDC